MDPDHIKEGPLAYLILYFYHLASSSIYSVSPVILNLDLLDYQESGDSIGESMCFTVTILKCLKENYPSTMIRLHRLFKKMNFLFVGFYQFSKIIYWSLHDDWKLGLTDMYI